MGTPIDDLRDTTIELVKAADAYGVLLDDLVARGGGQVTDELRLAYDRVQAATVAHTKATERWYAES